MVFILTVTVIILMLIKYLIFVDIILSWLSLLGLKSRPGFIASILDPLYISIKKSIPTTIGPMDFTPIVIIIIIELFTLFIYGLSKDVHIRINNLFAIFN